MNAVSMAAWVTGMMLQLQPAAPWTESYPASAQTIVDEAEDSPLFSGEDGVQRTVALLLSLGWYEGRFDPAAEDCAVSKRNADGTCHTGAPSTSYCMFQIDRSNLKMLGTTRKEILHDFGVCTRAALHMLRWSMRVCSTKPLVERLAHYAFGGPTCGGPKQEGFWQSRVRMAKANWIFGQMVSDDERD